MVELYPESYLASTVILSYPYHFGYNKETAASNKFQKKTNISSSEITKRAQKEFEDFRKKLTDNGVEVLTLHHNKSDILTDAVFPNNWFSTTRNEIILYPLLSPNRRKERDTGILQKTLRENGFKKFTVVDFTDFEERGLYLEGTGSVVFDNKNRRAYAVESPRTSREVFDTLCDELDLNDDDRIFFRAFDKKGHPIYHTNVIMTIGDRFCIVCLESIQNDERAAVKKEIESSGLEIIDISYEQVYNFCGNVINLSSYKNESLIIMSDRAFTNFNSEQIISLKKYGKIISSDIKKIETVGGGGIRCMVAEVFLGRSTGYQAGDL